MSTSHNATDLTLTLTPGEQLVFKRALKMYHQERRATFAAQVTVVTSGTPKPSLADSRSCALVLGLVESCRAKLGDDTWSAGSE